MKLTRGRSRWLAAALALATLAGAFGRAAAAPPSGHTLFVDDDRAECPSAQYTTISAAVAAAQAGDRINVCPGSYHEQVTVDKTLTINAQARGNIDGRCAGAFAPDPKKDAIIQGVGPSGDALAFNVQANNVVIDSFTVQNSDGPGIYTSPSFSGYIVRNSLIQNNVFGVYFNSSGATQSRVTNNCLRSNNAPGAASGNGVYTDQGLQNALINGNDFFNNQNAGILLTTVTAPLANITVSSNTSLQDATLIAAFLSSNVTIADNQVRKPLGAGIFVGTQNTGTIVRGNDLSGGASNGIRFNIASVPGPTNTNAQVRNNTVRNFAGSGIAIAPNSLTNSQITGNTSNKNTTDGILIDAGGNSGNAIRGNDAHNNGHFDCEDGTTGTGTAHTANTWQNNNGKTSSPAGLCTPGR